MIDLKKWTQGPIRSSIMHAIITVLGLWPERVPKGAKGKKWRLGFRSIGGPLGMMLFGWSGVPWLWLLASTATLIWYWLREWDGTRLLPKPKYRIKETLAREAVRYTWLQRYDTWFDVIVPTVAYGFLVGLLFPLGVLARWPF